jgi:hypothetical protein
MIRGRGHGVHPDHTQAHHIGGGGNEKCLGSIGRQGGNGGAVRQAHTVQDLNDLTELTPHRSVRDMDVPQHKSVPITTALNRRDDQIAHTATLEGLIHHGSFSEYKKHWQREIACRSNL